MTCRLAFLWLIIWCATPSYSRTTCETLELDMFEEAATASDLNRLGRRLLPVYAARGSGSARALEIFLIKSERLIRENIRLDFSARRSGQRDRSLAEDESFSLFLKRLMGKIPHEQLAAGTLKTTTVVTKWIRQANWHVLYYEINKSRARKSTSHNTTDLARDDEGDPNARIFRETESPDEIPLQREFLDVIAQDFASRLYFSATPTQLEYALTVARLTNADDLRAEMNVSGQRLRKTNSEVFGLLYNSLASFGVDVDAVQSVDLRRRSTDTLFFFFDLLLPNFLETYQTVAKANAAALRPAMRKVTRSQKHGNAWKELKQKHARAANLMDADRRRASELLSAKDSHLTFVLRDIMPRHAHDLESALVNYARRINKI